MTVDLAHYGWMIPFSIFGLSGYLALFFGLLGVLFAWIPWRGISRVILFAAAWFICEWLRGHLLTGFPWNVLSLAWSFWPAALQGVALWGAYGLSFFTVILFAMPAAIPEDARARNASLVACAIALLAFAAGSARIYYGEHGFVEGVHLRIVQAAIPQDAKWDPVRQIESIRKTIRMTQSKGYAEITHVIWPETAIPFVLEAPSELLSGIAQQAPASGALLTGGLRAKGQKSNWQVWNSFYVIGKETLIESSYDKVKLVPFGEFVPWRKYLPVEKITPGTTDFTFGSGPQTVEVHGAPPVQPMICYEGIFSGFAPQTRAGWLVNITNDAWFGTSTGPYQHLHLVQMRSVEQGLPMVRAANTGISAVVDGYGTILSHLPLNESSVLDSALPKELPGTLFGSYGYFPFLLTLFGMLAGAIYLRK